MQQTIRVVANVAMLCIVALPSHAQWFGSPISTIVTGHPAHMDIGNFNGDAFTDWVTVVNEAKLFVGIGNGTGTFTVLGPFATPSQPYRVAAGDLNGDDLDDVAVAIQGGTILYLYYNSGAGNLITPPSTLTCSGWTRSIAIRDLDDDDRNDALVSAIGGLEVFWGQPGGFNPTPTIVAVSSIPVPNWGCPERTEVTDLDVDDIDGSGTLDIVVAGWYGTNECQDIQRRALGYILNGGARNLDASATWLIEENVIVSHYFHDIELSDIDTDSRLDIAFAPVDSPHRYLLNSPLGWYEGQPFGGATAYKWVTFADFNGDGVTDTVAGLTQSFKVGQGFGADGFVLVENGTVGLGAVRSAEIDGSPGVDVIGFGLGTINFVPNLADPTAVAESAGLVARAAMTLRPSVVTDQADEVRIALEVGDAGARWITGSASVVVCDAGGRVVARVPMRIGQNGRATGSWCPLDVPGHRLSRGVYHVRTQIGVLEAAARLVIVK